MGIDCRYLGFLFIDGKKGGKLGELFLYRKMGDD